MTLGKNLHLLPLAALFGLFAMGCGPSFVSQTPGGFVELDNDHDSYDYRATTADGVVIAVREIDNEGEGGPEFWLTAIKNRMRERGGYKLIDEVPVKSADGVSGTQLQFGHDDGNNKPHLYYLAVFVTPETIWLVEAGGTKEQMTAEAAKVAESISRFSTG
jgi:hypothetical protein